MGIIEKIAHHTDWVLINQGIKADVSKITAIVEMPTPGTSPKPDIFEIQYNTIQYRLMSSLYNVIINHCGMEATLRLARETVYWPNITDHIKNKMGNCVISDIPCIRMSEFRHFIGIFSK
jgi:hypothetical protein